MKKLFLLIFVAAMFSACSNSPLNECLPLEKQAQNANVGVQRFKMMGTDNFHILLKWDSRTGEVWMVQYALNDSQALENLIPHSKIVTEEEGWNGRFELYPTRNMFNFVMIDTYTGYTYQVQWNTDAEYCFVAPITGRGDE